MSLTQASFLRALGRHPKANVRREGEERVPAILQGKALKPFISEEILEKSRPITFRLPTGGRASGYNAELLPAVCEIYLAAGRQATCRRTRSTWPNRPRSWFAVWRASGSSRLSTKRLATRRFVQRRPRADP